MQTTDAVTRLIGHAEGGYSNNPNDRGGETIFGIARKYHPSWPGWALVDAGVRVWTPEMARCVADFYEVQFWKPLGCGSMPDVLAYELFEQAVNMGIPRAARNLQEALNLLNRNGQSWPDITVDGKIGPTTQAIIRQVTSKPTGERDLVKVMNALQAEFYLNLVRTQGAQEEFLRGWLNRT